MFGFGKNKNPIITKDPLSLIHAPQASYAEMQQQHRDLEVRRRERHLEQLRRMQQSGFGSMSPSPMAGVIPNHAATRLPEVNVYDTIVEIHNAFDTASDKALGEAKRILEDLAKADHSRGKRLAALGFTATPEAKAYQDNAWRESDAKILADKLIDMSVRFPNYKFIEKSVVTSLCKKYDLTFGEVSRYAGNIPDKNLSEMEKFKEVVGDITLASRKHGRTGWVYEYKDKSPEGQDEFDLYGGYEKAGFFICAPNSEMKLGSNEYRDENGRIQTKQPPVPDPIVLYPLSNDGYLIVSKWGLEGMDPSLVNENHN